MQAAKKFVELAILAISFYIVSASFTFPAERMENGPLIRLNIPQGQLKQMCDSNLENLHKTIITYAELIDSHLSVLYKARPLAFFDHGVQLDTQRCEEDGVVKSKFALLLSMIELCVDPEDRLSDYQEEIFIENLLKVVCKMYSLDPRNNIEHGDLCMLEFAKKRDMCVKNFKKIRNILLPLVNTPQDCSETKKFFICLDEATSVKSCTDSMRRKMQSLNNMTYYDLYGCTDENPEVEFSNVNEEIINVKTVSKENKLNRFPISKPELKEKCKLKGRHFLNDLENSLAESMILAVRKEFRMTLTAKMQEQKDKEQIHIIVNEYCYNDGEVKKSFAKMLNAVQQCLDEKDYIDEKEKEKILKESIDILCYKLESTLWITSSDQDCFRDFGIFFKKAMCNKQASKFSVEFYSNLPLPFVSSPKECSNLYRMQNCELNIFEDCYDSTKLELKKQYNLLRKLSGCDEMYILNVD